MSNHFLKDEQVVWMNENLRVGSGFLAVKTDEGEVKYIQIYIDHLSGEIRNPQNGELMFVFLSEMAEAQHCLHTDPPSALVSAARISETAGG